MNTDAIKKRIYAVDLLRGLVMMIMLLDHTRDFVHSGGLNGDPTDLATTTVPLFFTRWITHFCAPIFVFLSGVSIYLQQRSGKTAPELSRFLFTRGLWLVFLEFTVVRFGLTFNLDYTFAGLAQVIWVIGVSMIVMSGLIYLPRKVVGYAGLAMIVLHNILDLSPVPPQVAFSGQLNLGQAIWLIFHQPGIVPVSLSGSYIFFAYPLIPWIGVMAVGWAFGSIYSWEAASRRKVILTVGLIATVLFAVIRAINIYGDPSRWSIQSNLPFSVLSFLNTTKYPPSLDYLLMTIGPGLIILSLTDGIDGKAVWQWICITFGRVPMFYYILQWYVAHGIAVVFSLIAGKEIGYLFLNPLESGQKAPPDHGFSLGIVYLAWIIGLVILFPLCRWWGNLKQRNKHWTLSYL